MVRAGLFLCLWVWSSALWAETILRAATAANFAPALKALALAYKAKTGVQVQVITGSSGKLAFQIARGAPYDLFFSADAERPQWLYRQKRVERPLTYAVGVLVLWQKSGAISPKQRLMQGDFSRLSIANPKTAPYGRAAQETLQALGRWQQVQAKLVRGENVGQAFQYVYSGNAQLGFVALSQVLLSGLTGAHHSWRVPVHFHQPLIQQAAVIHQRPNQKAAQQFLHWVVHAPEAKALIQKQGYALP